MNLAQAIAAAAVAYALYQTAPTWLPWLRRATDWIERRYGVDLPEFSALDLAVASSDKPAAPGTDAVQAAWQLAQALDSDASPATREKFRHRIEAGALLALSDLSPEEPA